MASTSLPPNAPMTNGEHTVVNGEADVSSHSRAYPATAEHSLEEICALLHGQVSSFLAAEAKDDVTSRTQEQTRISMRVIEKALEDYGFSGLSLSYNGGKDCLVLLILYLAILHTHFSSHNTPKNGTRRSEFPKSIPSIYAKPPDPFPAVTEFVDYSSALYHLDLTHILTSPSSRRKDQRPSNPTTPATSGEPSSQYTQPEQEQQGVSFRDAFALYLSTHPQVRAIFVGTRRTDPHGNHLTHFDCTDGNWPAFMRIHPVIDWHLSEIWCFLRSPHLSDLGAKAPTTNGVVATTTTGRVEAPAPPLRYCEMYDQGYTSLGGVNDTVRNPRLRYVDEEGKERFRPAYEMTWDQGERLGRE